MAQAVPAAPVAFLLRVAEAVSWNIAGPNVGPSVMLSETLISNMDNLLTAIIFEAVYMQDRGLKYAAHLPRQQITDPKWGNPEFMSEVTRTLYQGA